MQASKPVNSGLKFKSDGLFQKFLCEIIFARVRKIFTVCLKNDLDFFQRKTLYYTGFQIRTCVFVVSDMVQR